MSSLKNDDETYFSAVFETAGVALLIVESNNIISRVNKEFVKLSGFPREEVEGGMKWTDFIQPKYLEEIRRYHDNRLQGKSAPTEYECEVKNKQGEVKHVRVNVNLIPGTKKSIGSLLDLTDIDKSREKYEKLFESSITGIFIHDMDGNIIDVNNKVVELVGYSREELLSKKWGTSVAPIEQHRVQTVFNHVKEEGYYVETTKFLTKDGKTIDVEIHGSIVEVDGTKYIQSHITDVSEQVRLKERYSGFMQSATDAFSIYDEDLNIVDVNRKWLNDTGFKRFDVIGKNILQVFPELDETGRYSAYKKVLNSGQHVEFESTANPELLGRFFDIKAFKIKDHLGLISSEVTDKIQYQRKLEALHRHVSSLAKTDSRQEIAKRTMDIIHNLLGYEIGSFGYVVDDKIEFTEIREESSVTELSLQGVGITVRAVKTGETQLVDDTRNDPDYVSGRVDTDPETLSELDVPVKVDGEVVALINLESNETHAFSPLDKRVVELLAEHVSSKLVSLRYEVERLRAEEAERLEELKSRFLRTATHELRTPLTSVKGFLELAQGETDPKVLQRYLDIVYRNTERLELLTEDLLDQQRLEDGRLKLNLETVDISDLVRSIYDEILNLVDERCQRITVDMPDSLVIKADSVRLGQVLINLIDNAAKYSPDGSTIRVTVDKQDDLVLMSVRDEGYGFTDEEMDKLFTPFPGIDRPVVSEQSVGLGLSICKGIVELHGGEIWVESVGRNKGSTFMFTIPVSQ